MVLVRYWEPAAALVAFSMGLALRGTTTVGVVFTVVVRLLHTQQGRQRSTAYSAALLAHGWPIFTMHRLALLALKVVFFLVVVVVVVVARGKGVGTTVGGKGVVTAVQQRVGGVGG